MASGAANEAYAPTADAFPAGVVPNVSSHGTAPLQTVSCTWTGGTIDARSSYNTATVPANVSSGATLGAAKWQRKGFLGRRTRRDCPGQFHHRGSLVPHHRDWLGPRGRGSPWRCGP